MHQLNELHKSTSSESIKNAQSDNAKENQPQLTGGTAIDVENVPLTITGHSSIQHDRQELFHQYGPSCSTDSATGSAAKKPPLHQTVTFSSEINLANQARCSVLQVVQAANKPSATTKTIKSADPMRPHLQLNFAHSFRHPVSGSLDETAGNPAESGQLTAVNVINRGSAFLLSKSPPTQHHHTILTSPYGPVGGQLTSPYVPTGGQLTSPSYRTINLSAAPTGGLNASDIYRGRRCFKRSISLASAQSHHHLSQQMSLTQPPFGGGHHHRRTLLADYGRRRAYLDSFE